MYMALSLSVYRAYLETDCCNPSVAAISGDFTSTVVQPE